MSGPGDWADDAPQSKQPYRITPPQSAPPPEMELFISSPCGELFGALASAQAEIQNPKKDKRVKIRMKTGAEYTYNYADLSTMLDETRPMLAKHGLSVVQIPSVSGDYLVITTVLGHSSGQYLKSSLVTRSSSDMKEFGGQITYLRRYAYGAVICIASDDDLDGDAPGAAPDKTYEKRNGTPRPASAPLPPPPAPAGQSPAQVKAEIADLKKQLGPATTNDVLFELGFQNEAGIKTLNDGKRFLAALRTAAAPKKSTSAGVDDSDLPEGLFPPTQTHSGVNYPD